MAEALTLPFPVHVDSECPPDHIWLVPSDIANRLNLWPFLDPWQQFKLECDFRKAVKEKRAGLITNVNFEQGDHMDIPRTYLVDVARAALLKINPAEPPQSVIDEAVVELQGVMNLIARNATDLVTTDFERAAVEALAEKPLNRAQ